MPYDPNEIDPEVYKKIMENTGGGGGGGIPIWDSVKAAWNKPGLPEQYDLMSTGKFPSVDALESYKRAVQKPQMPDMDMVSNNPANAATNSASTSAVDSASDITSEAVKRAIASKGMPKIRDFGSVGSIEPTSNAVAMQAGPSKPYGFGNGLDDNALMGAQQLAQSNRSGAGYGQAFNTAINAIAGTKPDNSFYDNLRKEAGQPVDDIMARRKGLQENQKFGRESALYDPESMPSKIAQNLAYSQLVESGMKPDDAKSRIQGMSAADLKDFGEKAIGGLETQADRKESARLRASLGGDQKQSNAMQQALQLIESARGNQAVQKAEQDLYNVSKINSLVQNFSNPSPQMAKLLYTEIAKVANGGQATMEELKGLDPHLVTGALAGAWQRLSGNPTPANAQAFVKDYANYANTIAGDAKNLINDRYGRIIESVKDRVGSENYKTLQNQYINRFKNGPQPASTNEQVKEIGGVKYKKVQGGWVEVPNA
jgi:hypothetical protein